MDTTTETTATKSKAGTPKRAAALKPATSKAASSVPRRAARAKSTPATKSVAAKALQNVPQWLTVGASITGAAVAIGATLFATRNEWLPRARKFGNWVEQSVGDQLDNFGAVKSNAIEAVKARTGKKMAASVPVAAASFEPSGADANTVIN